MRGHRPCPKSWLSGYQNRIFWQMPDECAANPKRWPYPERIAFEIPTRKSNSRSQALQFRPKAVFGGTLWPKLPR